MLENMHQKYAQLEDKVALKILLGQRDIDTNVKTTAGLTPLLLAAAKGKMVSIEILLADSTHERLAVTGMNVLDVALDVVMFYHFATQNTLIPSVHTPHKGLWKMALVNSF